MENKLFDGLLELLRGDGSIIINKSLAHNIGLEATVIYSELVSKYKYWSNRGELTADGFFYCTVDDLEASTTLSKHIQSKAISKLVELGLIGYDPRRKVGSQEGKTLRHFKIVADTNLILSLLSENAEVKAVKVVETIENAKKLKNLTTGEQESGSLVSEKVNTNNTNLNNTNSNNKRAVGPAPAASSNDDEVIAKELIIFYEECFAKMPTKQIVRAIKDFRDKGMSIECLSEAMRRAGERGKDWAYTTGILNSWIEKEAFTLEAVAQKDQKKTTAPVYASPADEPLTHKNKFTRTYSHNWDQDALEEMGASDLDRELAKPHESTGIDIRVKYGLK